MPKNKLTLKIIFFLASTDVLETFINFCFKKSALAGAGFSVNSVIGLILFIKAVALSIYLWLGFLGVILLFAVWSTILSRIDLSIAVPVASLSYILVPISSIIFLGEKVPPLRWIGILIILSGVILVSLTANKKEDIPL